MSIAICLSHRIAHQRHPPAEMGQYRGIARRGPLYAHLYSEDQDTGNPAAQRGSIVILRRAESRTGIQRIEPCPHPRAIQELAKSRRNHQENHLPRSAPHIRHPADNQRHRHLHRIEDAHPQKRRHNANLRRSRQPKETRRRQ